MSGVLVVAGVRWCARARVRACDMPQVRGVAGVRVVVRMSALRSALVVPDVPLANFGNVMHSVLASPRTARRRVLLVVMVRMIHCGLHP